MSQAPSMPIFTDALLGDTTHLSMEEFGAYCMILFVTWRNNGAALPDDDVRFARMCRVTVGRWRSKIRPALEAFFDLSGGTWRQKRLEKEWEFVQERAANSRRNGSKGGRPKPQKTNDTANPAGSSQDTPEETPEQPTHTHTHTQSKGEVSPSTPLAQATPPKAMGRSRGSSPVGPEMVAEFEAWWQHYPRKKAKPAAMQAYVRARRAVSAAELLAGAMRYAAEKTGEDERYIAHPTTWLNQGRWTDEASETNNARNHQPSGGDDAVADRRRAALADAVARRMEANRDGPGYRRADEPEPSFGEPVFAPG